MVSWLLVFVVSVVMFIWRVLCFVVFWVCCVVLFWSILF